MKTSSQRFRSAWLRVLLGLVALSVVTAVLTLLAGLDERVLGSSALVTGGCIVATIALWGLTHARRPSLLWVALAAIALDTVVGVALVWVGSGLAGRQLEYVIRGFGLVGVLGGWGLLCGLAGAVRFRTWWWHVAPWSALVLVNSLAAMAALALIFPVEVSRMLAFVGEDLMGTVIAVMCIVAAAVLLALPVMAWLDRLPSTSQVGTLSGGHMQVGLTCPRCAAANVLDVNTSGVCTACRLEIRVEMQEPRCACGYLLHKLTAPACPECGALLTADQQWGTAAREA